MTILLIRFSVFMCVVLKLSAGQNCESKVTCDKCIQEFNCFWCSSVVIVIHLSRLSGNNSFFLEKWHVTLSKPVGNWFV